MTGDIKFYIKICVSSTGGAKDSFGPGTAQLLRGIKETGSLNKATKAMNMAYSKAWHVLNTAEEQLGFKLIERNGANGSLLTDRGERFLELYGKMQAETDSMTSRLLKESGLFD